MLNPRNETMLGAHEANYGKLERASDKPKEPRLFDLISSHIDEHKAAAARLEALLIRLPRHFGEAKVSELRSMGLDFEPWRLSPPIPEPVPVEDVGCGQQAKAAG